MKIQLLVSSQQTAEPVALCCSMLSGTVNLALVLPCHPPPHPWLSLWCLYVMPGYIGPAVLLISVCHLVIERVTANCNGPESRMSTMPEHHGNQPGCGELSRVSPLSQWRDVVCVFTSHLLLSTCDLSEPRE